MATKSIVPRASGEGGLGTSSKLWKEAHHVTASFGDVSLTEDSNNRLQVSGGPLVAASGLSGSLTQLSDGSSFIIEGSNMTVTSASNGAITLASTDTDTTYTAGDGLALSSTTFSARSSVAVTVWNSKFKIDGTSQQTLSLAKGVVYYFDQSDASNATHPLRLSTTSDGSHGGGSEYTTGVTTGGTPGSAGAYTQVILEQDAPSVLYYYCTAHSGMGGKAETAPDALLTGDRTFANNLTVTGDLTVNGTTTTVDTTNLLVTDKLITLNDGGAASSGGGAGIEIEEDGSATGFIKVASDRAGWELQAPGNSNTLTIDPGASKTLTISGDLTVNADTTISSFGASLVDDANASAARTTLGVAIGSDVQAWDADLDTLSGMQSGAPGALALLTQAELEILDGANVTTSEINLLDTSAISAASGSSLRYDGSSLQWEAFTGGGGGLSNIVEDTTPQLGGTLDLNSQAIQGDLIPSAAGTYDLGSTAAEWTNVYLSDSGKVIFGNDQDIQIQRYGNGGVMVSMDTTGNGYPEFWLEGRATGNIGPEINLWHNSTSPAANDIIGTIQFYGEDSGGSLTSYGKTLTQIIDATNGSETSKLLHQVMAGGTITTGFSVEGTSTAGVSTVDITDHDGSTGGLELGGTLVTAPAAELNLLDGATSATSTTVADADRVILNDNGTMVQVAMSDIKTYTNAGLGGGGGGGKHGLTETKSASFTTTAFTSAEERQLYIVDSASAVTATLADPGATTYDGYEINIKRLGAGTVHITGSTGVLGIDGSATFDLPSQYSSVTLVATGSQYVII